MENELKKYIESSLELKITSLVPVSGGDISTALKITAGTDQFFCKYQAGDMGYSMLKAENDGLEAIAATGFIKTPRAIHLSKMESGGCLLLEYIESKGAGEKDMVQLGRQLAGLHTAKAASFGWDTDNYIGSLSQYNTRADNWAGFYTSSRLLPQLKMAHDKDLLSKRDVPPADKIEMRLHDICSPCEPSLIHGDLWGGNYLIAKNGSPYLIDPGVSYSHPGMDIAMSRLFGGFSSSFYHAYEEASDRPLPSQAEIELYQLYYLLVHLNIFGSSYASSVRDIVKRYF
ncbi:fructosamine kinase family protein [Muriicola sp. SD30]|uniref:fructosamine kinase family protein n=1 Tax=Muriicola sp. SD30 TaxID=3240936 RepID=UPI0035105E57